MTKIFLQKSPFSRNKKSKLKQKIHQFLKKYQISHIPKSILIDWTPKKKVNTYGGYFGGFLSMYNEGNIYINLSVFYELTNLSDMKQVLWAIIHELIHAKQIYEKEIIISVDANQLEFDKKTYQKLNFRAKKYFELYEKGRMIATNYHIKEIPWEREPYYISDIYTNTKSFDHNL